VPNFPGDGSQSFADDHSATLVKTHISVLSSARVLATAIATSKTTLMEASARAEEVLPTWRSA